MDFDASVLVAGIALDLFRLQAASAFVTLRRTGVANAVDLHMLRLERGVAWIGIVGSIPLVGAVS